MKRLIIITPVLLFVALASCSKKLLVAPTRTYYPQDSYHFNTAKNTAVDSIKLVRIAHATTLITVGDKIILTDPWFSEMNGYYHGEPLAFSQDKLPKLSMVLISHCHYDHFDIETFKTYPDKHVPFIVPIGLGKKVREAGFDNVYEIDPWQSATIDGVKITACPAKHGVKENTYVIETGARIIFFGGDSEFIPGLLEIKNRFPVIDLALLSVNGLAIRPMFNKKVVMDATQAAELCSILRPKVAVPIHYNFTGGKFKDHFILKYNSNAEDFIKEAAIKAPNTKTYMLQTGDVLFIK